MSPLPASVVFFCLGVTMAHAELPKVCEDPKVAKSIYKAINEIPALKQQGLQAVDYLDAKTLSVGEDEKSYVCTALVKWSNNTSERVKISISKNSMGEDLIKIEDDEGKP